ncbi:hypothetical protein [Mesorhizobium sp. M0698]|uniref:hypothetical protein n=1 Tax=Mesorhizobium sp. M0698 TaxID=2956987 RepID=UPI00333640CB
MEDDLDDTTRMSFVIRLSLFGNAWIGSVTRVAADGVERSNSFQDCQSMLDFIHEQLAEKTSIPLPVERSVS